MNIVPAPEEDDRNAIVLTWNQSGRESGFEVEQCDDEVCKKPLFSFSRGDPASIPVDNDGLKNELTATLVETQPDVSVVVDGYAFCSNLQFKVRAVKDEIPSGNSAPGLGFTRPPAPSGVKADPVSAHSVSVAWTDGPLACANGFQIVRCQGDDCDQVGEAAGGESSFPDESDGIEECGSYEYQVRAIRRKGQWPEMFSAFSGRDLALTPIAKLNVKVDGASGGDGAIVAPKSQQIARVSVGRPCEYEVTGRVDIGFEPDSAVAPAPNTPQLALFAQGPSTTFTIEEGKAISGPLDFQTHTVAGSIEIIARQEKAADEPVAVVEGKTSARVPLLQPVLLEARLEGAAGDQRYVMELDGYSTTREISETDFDIRLQTGEHLVAAPDSFSQAFAVWYRSSDSWDYGSCFTLRVEIDFSDADPAAMTVQLRNTIGPSDFICSLEFPNGFCVNLNER